MYFFFTLYISYIRYILYVGSECIDDGMIWCGTARYWMARSLTIHEGYYLLTVQFDAMYLLDLVWISDAVY